MSLGSFNPQGRQQPVAEINVVPLVDVMLVLLVVFIITAPLLTHAVKVELPQAASHANATPVPHVALAIGADGRLFWNGEAVPAAALPERLAAAARETPQPELHLRADRRTHYETVAVVMSQAAKAGLGKIGFVTDPSAPAR